MRVTLPNSFLFRQNVKLQFVCFYNRAERIQKHFRTYIIPHSEAFVKTAILYKNEAALNISSTAV